MLSETLKSNNVCEEMNLPESVTENVGGKIVPFGSYYLEVHTKGADIDALCVAPGFIERKVFFTSFFEKLKAQEEVKDIRAIEKAFVPVIKLSYYGIEFDLVFARVALKSIPENLNFRNNNLIRGINKFCARSLNGYRVTDEILRLVTNVYNFRLTLRAIKLWAKRSNSPLVTMHRFTKLYRAGLVESKIRLLVGILERNEHISLAHTNVQSFPGSTMVNNKKRMRTMWLIGVRFKEGHEKLKINLTPDLLSFSDTVYSQAERCKMYEEGMTISVTSVKRENLCWVMPNGQKKTVFTPKPRYTESVSVTSCSSVQESTVSERSSSSTVPRATKRPCSPQSAPTPAKKLKVDTESTPETKRTRTDDDPTPGVSFSESPTPTLSPPSAKRRDTSEPETPAKKFKSDLVAAVRVKILAGGTASRIVELDGGPRELMELCVCDRSGQTKLTLWEEKIAMVQDSKSYHITNLYTRKFDDKTILTSSRHTTITEIEDVGEPDMLEPCVDLPKISGCVIGSETAVRYHCGICRGSQSNFNAKNEAHRCNKCNMMQKCTNFRTLYAGKLLLLQNGQELSLTLTNSAVLHFISEHLGGGATDVDAIDCKLIGLGNVELDVGSNNAILRIKVRSDGAACVNSVEESQRQKDTDTAQCMGSDPFEDDDDALRLLD
ncbi:hypothetical protein PAMA_012926 [Pampus argenteus]